MGLNKSGDSNLKYIERQKWRGEELDYSKNPALLINLTNILFEA